MLNPNLYNDMKTDLSKRFDAFLRQEMFEHQKIIVSHNQEMQSLRDFVQKSLDKFSHLFKYAEQELKEKTSYLEKAIDSLKFKINIHEVLFEEQKKNMLYLHQQIHDFYLTFATKKDVENHKNETNLKAKECAENQINSFQLYQQEMKSLINSLMQELMDLKMDMKKKYQQLVEIIEEKFNLSKMDKDGILKEIRVYEKSMFIIEKKIENIYTLIERIHKKGKEICHKPV